MDYPIVPDGVPFGSHDLAPVTGTPALFTGGNPVSGIAATVVTGAALNMLVIEMRNVLLAAGLTPAVGNWFQLAQGTQSIGSREIVFMAGAVTFTVPANVFMLRAEGVGAGGSGGGSTSVNYPGGGGGGAGVGTRYIPVTPGQVLTGAVGAGQVAGNGQDTTLFLAGAQVLGCGGGVQGGLGSASNVGIGGVGGNVIGCPDGISGAAGSSGILLSGATLEGGRGGGNRFVPPQFTVGTTGAPFSANAGNFPGGGSTGCTGSTAPGANGRLIIRY